MPELKFYGASDDLFEIDGALRDEIDCYDTPVVLHLAAGGQRLAILGHYAPENACTWAVGVALVEEDDPLPDWPMRFIREHEYSVALVIDVPEPFSLTHVGREESRVLR